MSRKIRGRLAHHIVPGLHVRRVDEVCTHRRATGGHDGVPIARPSVLLGQELRESLPEYRGAEHELVLVVPVLQVHLGVVQEGHEAAGQGLLEHRQRQQASMGPAFHKVLRLGHWCLRIQHETATRRTQRQRSLHSEFCAKMA